MVLVGVAEDSEWKERQKDEEHVANLAAHFPRWDLSWVRFFTEVVNSTMEPVAVAINMELFKVTELI